MHRSAHVEQSHPYRNIKVHAIDAALGAEVECGDLRHASDVVFEDIRRAWLDHLVLRFSGQTLNDQELLALGSRFGALDDSHRPQPKDQPGQHAVIKALTVISNVVENGMAIGALGDADLVWHTDMSYTAAPPDASLLYALEVPNQGGETGFCNMYLAFETLPAELRKTLATVQIKHDSTHNSGGFLRSGFDRPADVSRSPGMWHPAVRTHPETGRDALYLGRRPYSYVKGMSVADSEALLDYLWSHACRPEFSWDHKWSVGDIVMWDNRCAMHRRNAFPPDQRRVMHRTQIKGTVPVRDVSVSVDAPPHPRASRFITAAH